MKPNGDCLRGWQECAAREHRARRSAPGRGRALRHRWEAQLIPAQTSQVPPVVVPRQFLGSCPGRKARSVNRPSSTESKKSTRRQSGSYVPSFYSLTAGNLSKGGSLSSHLYHSGRSKFNVESTSLIHRHIERRATLKALKRIERFERL